MKKKELQQVLTQLTQTISELDEITAEEAKAWAKYLKACGDRDRALQVGVAMFVHEARAKLTVSGTAQATAQATATPAEATEAATEPTEPTE